MTSSRLIATRVIESVLKGISLTEALNETIVKKSSDKAFIQAMCFGVCREYQKLDGLLALLLTKPLKPKDLDIKALLLLGLYQLKEMHVPDYAAVTETVEVASVLKKIWAKGLVNAVMRNFLRQRASFESKIATNEIAHFAHPAWYLETIKKDWPSDWQAILHANNEHPPFACRINRRRVTREDYVRQLPPELNVTLIPETTSGIIFDDPLDVVDVPGFLAGDISVQDGAAQLAATLLELKPGLCVLDACAAPGGKLTAILECEPQLKKVVAVEKEKSRLDLIQENLTRLQLHATTVLSDVAATADWWDGEKFDRILLDVPCSASGVIRRHPDIKLLRQQEDIESFQKEQLRLLNAMWPLLAANGMLLYCTCSVFHAENQNVMQTFLQTHDDAIEIKIKASWGMPLSIGRQILPGMHHMDGFYYATLRKK